MQVFYPSPPHQQSKHGQLQSKLNVLAISADINIPLLSAGTTCASTRRFCIFVMRAVDTLSTLVLSAARDSMNETMVSLLASISDTRGFITFCVAIAVAYATIWALFLFESPPKKKKKPKDAEGGEGEEQEPRKQAA
jgi:hypothetical protein